MMPKVAPADPSPPPADRPLPPWTRTVDRLLAQAMRETKLLGVAAPLDAARERARLEDALLAGRDVRPAWRYVTPPPLDGLRRALDELALTLDRDGSELADAYAARARELAAEAAIVEAVGSPRLGPLARARFAAHGATAAEGSRLSRAWSNAPPPDARPTIVSDAAHPDSLLSRLRAEVGRRRLPFTVVPQPSLVPLAATGERTIWVAEDRPLTDEDVARTVLHEIEAHAVPRARALMLPAGLFGVGTAGGSDDQEGLALVLEARAGFLRAARCHELAVRHRAVEAMDEGATFADVARMLIADAGLSATRAVAVAERAFRGGDGQSAGLGRERVYLPCFLRVQAYLAERPDAERVLAAGQVSVDAVPLLAPFVSDEAAARYGDGEKPPK